MKWTLEAILSGVNLLSDGGVSLRFITIKDLDDVDRIALIHSHNKTGHIAFSEDEIQESDMPKTQTEGQKTPSQRLRNIIFVLWKQQDGVTDFEVFYRQRMEKILTELKGEIDQ